MSLLNQQKIDSLSKEIGSENVPVLLDIFLSEMDTYIKNLSSYQGAEQLGYLKEISHALKSSAASFGADRLCNLAIAIDIKAKTDDLSENSPHIVEMLELLKLTQKTYRAWG
ncbi:quorum-sensing phosphorelay protein LuxU [Vibrio mytili]|uniref:Phosphorelay protein LuxU n=2 Tax=Vibrio mytili TaxID=50718 RepID=A0A0C3I6P9_9VIBR|nr:phosphorelay protein LuxU [Vibrio mytili]